MTTWLDFKHPTYRAHAHRWTFTRDLYTGAVLAHDPPHQHGTTAGLPVFYAGPGTGTGQFSEATHEGHIGTVSHYLVRKATAETAEAYRERCRLADYTPHLATVVDSLAGMLFANEDDANRPFTEEPTDEQPNPFGSKDDQTSPIGQLWANADGFGTGWITLWKQLTTELILVHTEWVLVDSVDGMPQIRLIPPEAVPNWLDGPSGPIDVLVMEDADTRTSIEADPSSSTTTRYIRYSLEGWQRYEASPDGQPIALAGPENSGTYTFTDATGNAALPIYRITLPMARPVGWMLAKKANAIFNKESERDHLLRFANFPKLCIDAADDTTYDKIIGGLAKGASTLQGANHKFIAPDTGPATVATEVLKRKVEEFYVVAFREYGDAARERTATEVRQDVSSGVGAFLQMLKAALEDAENCALWRIAQVLWPDQPDLWWTARVTRSDEFLPGDINATIERTRAWFFGKDAAVPLGRSAKIAAAKQVADFTGIEVTDEDVSAAVDAQALGQMLVTLQGLPVPAQARAMLAVRALEMLGVIDPEAQVEMGDGQKRKLHDQLLEEAMQLAGAADEQQRQAAETFRQPVPGQDPGLSATGTDGMPTPGSPGGVNVTLQPSSPASLRVERDSAGRILRLVKE